MPSVLPFGCLPGLYDWFLGLGQQPPANQWIQDPSSGRRSSVGLRFKRSSPPGEGERPKGSEEVRLADNTNSRNICVHTA